MSVESLPEILSWEPQSEVLAARYRRYVRLLCDYFGQTLHKAKQLDQSHADRLLELFRQSSMEDVLRVITAPEVARLVLTQDNSRILESSSLLSDWFLAESVRSGRESAPDRVLWTALGDMVLFPDGSQQLFGDSRGIPLDFGSINLRKLDLDGEERSGSNECFEYYDLAEITWLRRALDAATAAIGRTSASVDLVVRTFIKVILLARTPSDRDSFITGSNSGWPGRAMILNADATCVTNANLADGLVHEAIHGLLTLERLDKEWAHDWPRLSVGRSRSPWTGRMLPVHAYLEACFVWYGLANFWLIAIDSHTFDHQQAMSSSRFALDGFRAGSLIESLPADLRRLVATDVLDTITEMQGRLLARVNELPRRCLE
jgi:hypothetical protein